MAIAKASISTNAYNKYIFYQDLWLAINATIPKGKFFFWGVSSSEIAATAELLHKWVWSILNGNIFGNQCSSGPDLQGWKNKLKVHEFLTIGVMWWQTELNLLVLSIWILTGRGPVPIQNIGHKIPKRTCLLEFWHIQPTIGHRMSQKRWGVWTCWRRTSRCAWFTHLVWLLAAAAARTSGRIWGEEECSTQLRSVPSRVGGRVLSGGVDLSWWQPLVETQRESLAAFRDGGAQAAEERDEAQSPRLLLLLQAHTQKNQRVTKHRTMDSAGSTRRHADRHTGGQKSHTGPTRNPIWVTGHEHRGKKIMRWKPHEYYHTLMKSSEWDHFTCCYLPLNGISSIHSEVAQHPPTMLSYKMWHEQWKKIVIKIHFIITTR